MQLKDFLKDAKIGYTEFAKRIDVANARTVQRYADGKRTPSREIMQRIIDETDGKVTPNDFHDLTVN